MWWMVFVGFLDQSMVEIWPEGFQHVGGRTRAPIGWKWRNRFGDESEMLVVPVIV